MLERTCCWCRVCCPPENTSPIAPPLKLFMVDGTPMVWYAGISNPKEYGIGRDSTNLRSISKVEMWVLPPIATAAPVWFVEFAAARTGVVDGTPPAASLFCRRNAGKEGERVSFDVERRRGLSVGVLCWISFQVGWNAKESKTREAVCCSGC